MLAPRGPCSPGGKQWADPGPMPYYRRRYLVRTNIVHMWVKNANSLHLFVPPETTSVCRLKNPTCPRASALAVKRLGAPTRTATPTTKPLEAPLQPFDTVERDHFQPLIGVGRIPVFIDGVVRAGLVPFDSKHLHKQNNSESLC